MVDRIGEAEPARGRVKAILDWLRGRGDTAIGRLALQWFRAYLQASRNSGCALAIYSSLSVLPAALVAISYFHHSTGDSNTFSQRLIDHLRLTGATADLVRETFGSASQNALAATVAVAFTFLLWGIGIGQIYQDVYSRAWGIEVGSAADQARFAAFFFVLAGAVALGVIAAAELERAGWYFLLPVWLVGSTVFWLWVPTFLLHRAIGIRALFPGALLASVVIGGAIATSPLFLAPSLNANGKAFSSLGVVLTLIGGIFVMCTMTLVCAVFAPVWAAWRRDEKERRGGRTPIQAL